MDLDRCLAIVREASGARGTEPVAPSEQEITALLDFTRAVAHASERKDAPLAAYALGVAMAGLDPEERVEVLSRAAQAIDRAAGEAVQ
jgi:hypothetical protein